MDTISRRDALTAFAAISLSRGAAATVESVRAKLPEGTPPGVAAILANTLSQEPGTLNTDWFGTLLVKGMLEWSRRGVPEAGAFARAWLESHLSRKGVSPYSGNKSRMVNAGGIAITTYCGHFGLAFPCADLAESYNEERARRVVIEVAKIILHQTARGRQGLVNHADTDEFWIPDTCYFVAPPLMLASVLDRETGSVFREQAVFQLRTFIDTFLDREKGLAKTILFRERMGTSYWTRATGWLLWSITGVLRLLPPPDAYFEGFVKDLRVLAGGISRAQDSSGALHLFVDDPASPLETTGTAMCAMGLHESVRRGWLPASFAPAADRAWGYVKQKITPDGKIVGAYTGWAVPAEQRIVEMDRVAMGWIPGFILSTASEFAG